MKKHSSKQSKRILNCVPSKAVENDWGLSAAVAANIAAAKNTALALTNQPLSKTDGHGVGNG